MPFINISDMPLFVPHSMKIGVGEKVPNVPLSDEAKEAIQRYISKGFMKESGKDESKATVKEDKPQAQAKEKTPVETPVKEKTRVETPVKEKTPVEAPVKEKTPVEAPVKEKTPVEDDAPTTADNQDTPSTKTRGRKKSNKN